MDSRVVNALAAIAVAALLLLGFRGGLGGDFGILSNGGKANPGAAGTVQAADPGLSAKVAKLVK